MKLFLKILKLLAILIVTVSILLFAASFLLQDKVADVFLRSLNNNLSTKLDIGSFKLSFLRKFPKASLELKNVLVHSSTDFDSREFTGYNTDTLLAARLVSVEFSITDIIKGNYNIESITAKAGQANFYTDSKGRVNYDISVKNGNSGKEVFSINLEKITLADINALYNNLAIKLKMNGVINTGKLKSRISGNNIDFTANSELEINRFQLYNTTVTKTIPASFDVTLQSSKNGILFKKSSLSFEKNEFNLSGLVSSDDQLDLKIAGHNMDIAKLRKYLPEKYLRLVTDYDPSGSLIVDCQIKGPLTRTQNPHIEINCMLNNGRIAYGKSAVKISNLSFAGHYSNGKSNNPATGSVSFKDIKVKLGSSDYTGSVLISPLTKPVTSMVLKGRVYPQELKEFFNLQKVSAAGGSVDVDLKLVTDFWPKDSITTNDIIDLKPEVGFVFNSFSFGLNNNNILVNNVNGNLLVSDAFRAENLSFNYKGQNIKVNGEFRNLPAWMAGRPVRLSGTADVSFNRFIPETFLKTSSSNGNTSAAKTAFSLPGDILLDVNFKIDSLNYKTFSSTKIAGTLSYRPRTITFKSLTMNSLNGAIAGNGFITQNQSKSVIARGNFNLTGINVNKAFVIFHNFGQEFIKAENLSGSLSGSISVLLPLDSMLNPQIKSLTAEGKYILVDGALINFGPVKELSSFIELSELENIHFDRLENDFFIRNNFLYLPQMDVKSSAADLSVNGKHSFDNDYEYHVKMLLSVILSKKRKINKSNTTEFGVVQDDGLGRTSILLKILGKGEELKVGYDIKAAGSTVKNNIKSERQNIKSILNEEYGWYKSDTVTKQKPVEKKSRFRISWEETDSVKSTTNPPVVNKEGGVKSLFKKK